jgi:hypothetical protein
MINKLRDIKQPRIMPLREYDCNSELMYLLVTYFCLNIRIYSRYYLEYFTSLLLTNLIFMFITNLIFMFINDVYN